MIHWLKSKFTENNKTSDDKTLVNKTLNDFITEVSPLDENKYIQLVSEKGYNGYKIIYDGQGHNVTITHNDALIPLTSSINEEERLNIILKLHKLHKLVSNENSNAQNPNIGQQENTIKCYEAYTNDNKKLYCPICKQIEQGTERNIPHTHGCPNYKKYTCQYIKSINTGIKNTRIKNTRIKSGNKRRRKKTNKKSKKIKIFVEKHFVVINTILIMINL